MQQRDAEGPAVGAWQRPWTAAVPDQPCVHTYVHMYVHQRSLQHDAIATTVSRHCTQRDIIARGYTSRASPPELFGSCKAGLHPVVAVCHEGQGLTEDHADYPSCHSPGGQVLQDVKKPTQLVI